MLNKNGGSGHTFLSPDLRERAFSFSPLDMMVLYVPFIMMSYNPFINLSNTFIIKYVEFCQKPFLQLLRWLHGFCSLFC
jgi:hypothetical protein